MGASCSSSTAVATRPSKSSEVRRSENALGKQIFVAPTNPDGTFMRPKFYLDRLVKGKVRWASVEDQTEPLTDEEILQVFEPIFAEGLLDRKATMSECTEDLVVRCIRGYVNNKPEVPKWVAAMEDMTPHAAAVGEGLEKIMAWRKRMQARTLLREHLEGAEKFYELWPFTCGGADDQGHLIFFERLREINYAEVLRTYTIDDILKYRAQAHELIQYWQLQEGHKQGRTIYKHLHVIDVGGITMRDFFKIKAVLQPIFKQTGDQYPNSLYRLFITNAPGIFQTIWKIISIWLDPETLLKIKIPPRGQANVLAEMEAAGIAPSALPAWLGGSKESDSVLDLTNRVIDQGGPTGRSITSPLPETLVNQMDSLRRSGSYSSDSFSDDNDERPIRKEKAEGVEGEGKSKQKADLKESLTAKNLAIVGILVLAFLVFLFALVDTFLVGNVREEIQQSARGNGEMEGGSDEGPELA